MTNNNKELVPESEVATALLAADLDISVGDTFISSESSNYLYRVIGFGRRHHFERKTDSDERVKVDDGLGVQCEYSYTNSG